MTSTRVRTAGRVAGLLTLMSVLLGCAAEQDRTDPPGGRRADDASTQDAFLKYAACMRENGIAMPDPKPGGGLLVNGKDVDPQALEAAEKKCHHLVEDALPDEGSMEVPVEQKESMLAQAACMRERGWDMPDPVFDGGRVQQQLDPGFDPSDPGFQRDQKECARKSGAQVPQFAGGPS